MKNGVMVLDKLYSRFTRGPKVCNISEVDDVFKFYKDIIVPINYISLDKVSLDEFSGYFRKDIEEKLKNYDKTKIALVLALHVTAAINENVSSDDVNLFSCYRYIILDIERLDAEDGILRAPIFHAEDVIDFGAEIIISKDIIDNKALDLLRTQFSAAFATQVKTITQNTFLNGSSKYELDEFINLLKIVYIYTGFQEDWNTNETLSNIGKKCDKAECDKRYNAITNDITETLMRLNIMNTKPIVAEYFSLSTDDINDIFESCGVDYDNTLLDVSFAYVTSYKALFEESEFDLYPAITFFFENEGNVIVDAENWVDDRISEKHKYLNKLKEPLLAKYREMQSRITAEEFDYLKSAFYKKFEQILHIKDNMPFLSGRSISMLELFHMMVLQRDAMTTSSKETQAVMVEDALEDMKESLFKIYKINVKLLGDNSSTKLETYERFTERVDSSKGKIQELLKSQEFKNTILNSWTEALDLEDGDLDESKYIN